MCIECIVYWAHLVYVAIRIAQFFDPDSSIWVPLTFVCYNLLMRSYYASLIELFLISLIGVSFCQSFIDNITAEKTIFSSDV